MTKEGHYLLPFVYSCNGRSFTKQIAEKSGTWFRDVRHHSHLKRPLNAFHSPQKLLNMLRNEPEAAQEKLENEPVDYLNLRYYQINAIHAVEKVLSLGQRDIFGGNGHWHGENPHHCRFNLSFTESRTF